MQKALEHSTRKPPFQRRRNLAKWAAESWRPPLFITTGTRWRRFLAAVRRWLDLQARSVWNDVAAELAGARGVVIDVGCGAQPYRELLPPGVLYMGIDTADAKEHFGYEIPDTLYYVGTLWPADDASADLVLATETLEHVLDAAQFLDEAHRCLRPGGRLMMTMPFAARWHFIPHDYWRFTPSSLEHLLKKAGFDDIAIYARGNAVTVACSKTMALILPLLLPQGGGMIQNLLRRILGLCMSPLLVLLAIIGNLSLRGAGGDDCLGYTVLAQRANRGGPTTTTAAMSQT
jgi:SAM-dependent methyltransferase